MTELNFTEQELKSIRAVHAPSATDDQFAVWIAHCKQRNLVPGQDVLLQIRTSKEWDPNIRARVPKANLVLVTTISALRKIAERTGKYGGPLPPEWVYLDLDGNPTIKSKVPLCVGKPKSANMAAPESPLGPTFQTPWAAIACIRRTDWSDPVQGIARFGAYAQTYGGNDEDGNKQVFLNQTWRTRGPEQLAKCAQAAAFREAFPETAGLYLEEELPTIPTETTPEPPKTLQGPAPTAVQAPAVNQTPAQPVADSRSENERVVNAVPVKPVSTPSAGSSASSKPDPATEGLPIKQPDPKKGTTVPEKSTDPRITEGLQKLKEEHKPITAEVDAFVESLTPINAPSQVYSAVPVQVNAAEPQPGDDEVPSTEERKALGAAMKERKLDPDALKDWIKNFVGATEVHFYKKMTRKQWREVNEKLDAAKAQGQAAIESLLGAKRLAD
jgi:hypothetical protein